jgi:hypothetical protein
MKIIIKLSNPGGELDRKELRLADPEGEGTLITRSVVEFIEGSILLPGDTITIEETDD